MPDLASKIKQFGLTQVYCSVEPPLVDIVFVHGLNGHPFNTWRSQSSGTFWPAELLPDVLDQSRVRILTYGYNANVTAFTDGVSQDRILQHAETLASGLAANRNLRKCSDRPIIFVCHSLGGLVVKRALIYCKSVSNERIEHLRSIFVSTYGILFLGTPHNGSDAAKWGLLLQNICAHVFPKKFMETSPHLVQALKSNNETLQNINSSFADMLSRFHIYFFHETRSMDVKGTREMIVDESSAAPYVEGVERMGIEADHSHMCKFDDENAPGYEAVAEALLRYSREAPSVISDRWVEEEKTRQVAKEAKAKEIFGSIYSTDFSNQPTEDKHPPSQSLQKEPLFVVPPGFHPNATFVGMQKELEILHARLYNAKKRAQRLVAVVICGGPGSGKSHLARQYVWAQRDCYPGGIFWVDAKSRESIYKCFWDIAQAATLTNELEFKSPESMAPQKYVEVVRNWFQGREEWLLIFDGLTFDLEDDLNHFKQFLPFNKKCSILYTSVDKTLRKKQRLYEPYRLQVPPLLVEDACKLLFKDLGIKRPTKEQIRKATDLVNHYECLPLAIHAISHRLSATSKAIERYHIDSHLTDEKLAEPFLSIMHDLYRMEHFEALNLINLLSFFGHHVPVGLITLGRSMLEIWNAQILTSSRPGEHPDIDTTLGVLIRYGLIERTSDSYALHLKNLSPQLERESILDMKAVAPDLSESQTESSQDAFSINQNSGSIDMIKIHSVVQGFCRDELRIMDKERQSQITGVGKWAAGYYDSWLVVATRVFCKSYENAKKRMDYIDDCGLVKDYREYETHASRLAENFPKRSSTEVAMVREAREDLKQVMRSISNEIERISPSSSQESVRKQRSVFDRSSSSSSSLPDSAAEGPSRNSTWDFSDMPTLTFESPQEIPVSPHHFNLSPFLPHIFRESSVDKETGYESDSEGPKAVIRTSPALSQLSETTERPKSSQKSTPPPSRDDQGWQTVEKPSKPRPGKERQPKQRLKFPRNIRGPKPAAPILRVFPVEGRSASSSIIEKGRHRSSVSASEALAAMHIASPAQSHEEIGSTSAENLSLNKENVPTYATVAARPLRRQETTGSSKQRSSSTPGERSRPHLQGIRTVQTRSSRESLQSPLSTVLKHDPLSQSTYSEPSHESLTHQRSALELGAAPESRYYSRHLSASRPMDMSASTPSALTYIPPTLPYENNIEITISRRLNPITKPVSAPISQSTSNLSSITHVSVTHPSAIMPGASPPPSFVVDAGGPAGYTSDPASEPMSRVASAQSHQSWSTEPVRYPPVFSPTPPNVSQNQLISGSGRWIENIQQPQPMESALQADVTYATQALSLQEQMNTLDPESTPPPTLHFGAHQVDVRARQRLSGHERHQVQSKSHMYHSNLSGPLIHQDMSPPQETYTKRARSGSSPSHSSSDGLGFHL